MLAILTKIFKFCKVYEKDVIFSAVIILISIISFGLGRLSKIRESRVPLSVENLKKEEKMDLLGNEIINETAAQKLFVASKNGKKYHYAWCDSAKSIKEENKVWFLTQEEARAAGYEPAANCKGL